MCSPFVLQLILVLPLDWISNRLLSSAQLSPCAPGSVGKGLKLEFGGERVNLERALPTEAAQLAGPNHSHTEQDRALCVLERALPTELLRQLSWLGRITHTQEQDRALCVLERALPTELLRQLSWLGRITHTQSKTEQNRPLPSLSCQWSQHTWSLVVRPQLSEE